MGLLPIAIGVGLMAAAIVVSSTRSRSDGDLDWSNYSVGLSATAALLVLTLGTMILGSGRGREELVTWPGVVGILGAATMLGIGLEDIDGSDDWLAYLVGGVVVVLAVVGYAAVRRGAFVITAIAGLGAIYAQLSDDVILDIGNDDDWAIIGAATVAAFVLGITALGWLLPSRALSGIVMGIVGVIGLNGILLALAVSQFFDGLFGGGDDYYDYSSTEQTYTPPKPPDYDNDVYIILAIVAVLTLLWALAASLEGNPGFTVLAIVMPAIAVPSATFVLAVEHPTWWGSGLAVGGGLILGAVGLKGLLSRDKT
ncbi:hypothetical protein F0U44_06925 [Nocardioides humilatus]|uniref:Uncharacterized protein n=1 Tax=Nocardioides humilatus TaxID=2607660 RepID=A0A5B1LNB8_9ACTN|nr:hypothetical protein [Nocardioides humilatus]KAA1421986.1 hypothetical protein F0U44_06925 [Nocardioides humilatus]